MSLKIENKGATFSSLSSFNTGFLFERRKIHNLKLLKLLDGLSKGSLLIEDQIIGEYIHYQGRIFLFLHPKTRGNGFEV